MSEQTVRLVAKMYEMRDTARNISGDNYATRVETYKQHGADTTWLIVWLTAAAVELMEGRDA